MRPATLPVVAALLLGAGSATAAESFRFPSIDGGEIDLAAFRGRPVLVVNTASQCGFTPQYDGLQALQDSYGPRGLVVLAIPSDDFNQELADETAVKDFCEVNFGLTLPMTEITHVKGAEAHPFYRWMDTEHDFSPSWNFNKVLLDGSGKPVATFGSFTKPQSAKLTAKIETLLPQ
ncbi:glutathione peroxidase [Rhodovulum sulfidophilum]|uniref:glutathione peroxidase n=1 Tax=Rhodovulum sulfidophilum TaxID=35806 RepID=UPI0019266B8A|nr:glutathione peroxidase [Rhodovulum sulfidophilum]MBL3583934.1 glutathione peroxidase [Rhodovulum sulfidophilum]